MIAFLRTNLTCAELAAGFGISPSTCWRDAAEGISVLADRGRRISLRDAARLAARMRWDYLIVDGTHDNRNSDLDDILGVKFTGNLPHVNVALLSSALLPAGSVTVNSTGNKVSLTTGAALATVTRAVASADPPGPVAVIV